ncbi:MAG TPA: LPS export ABC transporter permease LptF [Desulfuromonadales bacterium]
MSVVRLHRYIAREIAIPTLLGLIIFTFVLLMGRILKLVELVINKGIPAGEVVKLFGYLLPSFLVITIPLAFLLGVLLGFSRLSADSETIAMKASGISLYGMLKPVLALAILASLFTAYLTLYAGPSGSSAFRTQVFQIAASRASAGFQPRVFNDEFDGLVLYANDIQERSGILEGVFISDERVGTTPSIILARTGRVIPDRNALTLTLRLEDGTIHRRPDDKERDNYQVIDFSTYDINLNLGQQLPDTPQRRKKESELSTRELQTARDQAESPAERSGLTVEWHRRLILPMAPLLFALIGVPLGIRSQRSGRGGGFAAGLVVFLLYYLLLSFAETLAVEGGLNPVPVIWAPSVLFLAGSLVLLYMSAQEKQPLLLDRLLAAIRRRGRRKERGSRQ